MQQPPNTSFDTLIGGARDCLFEWFDLIDATNVSSVNKQTRLDVSEHIWGWEAVRSEHRSEHGGQSDAPKGAAPKTGSNDHLQNVRTSRGHPVPIVNLSNWRKCFPRAVSAKLSEHTHFEDHELSNLKGVRWLDQNGNKSITDNSLTVIGETVSYLRLENGTQITDKAFLHLKQIRRLILINCQQITDGAFSNLRNAQSIDQQSGNQNILRILHLCSCYQITDNSFSNLRKVQGLSLVDLLITDRALVEFADLAGSAAESADLQILCIIDCPNICLFGDPSAVLQGVPQCVPSGEYRFRNLHTVLLDDCPNVTDSSFRSMSFVDTLILNNCNQITGEGFRHFKNIQTLRVFACPITDQAFAGIGEPAEEPPQPPRPATFCKTLKELVLRFCSQITNEAFRSFQLLTELEEVNIQRCSQVSGSVVEHLHRVRTVKLNLSGV